MEVEIKKPNYSDNEIKLYGLLIDQILKYQSTLWQIPIALLVANIIVIGNFVCNPFPLMALLLFNFGIILIMHRMIKHQRQIINATENAEEKLQPIYGEFLPSFKKKHKLKASSIFIVILCLMELSLFVYVLTIIFKSK